MNLRKPSRNSKFRAAVANRAVRESEVFDNAPIDQVFLNDTLERLGAGVAIPHALGIDQCDGPALAYAQAVSARTIDAIEQSQFSQAPLEIIPCFNPGLACAALRFGLIGAEKNVTPHRGEL